MVPRSRRLPAWSTSWTPEFAPCCCGGVPFESTVGRARDAKMDQGFREELAGMDPQSVCRWSGAVQDRDGYRLRVLDSEYVVRLLQSEIVRSRVGTTADRSSDAISNALELVIVHYLINARSLPPARDRVGLKELGGGNQFFESHVPDFGRLLPRSHARLSRWAVGVWTTGIWQSSSRCFPGCRSPSYSGRQVRSSLRIAPSCSTARPNSICRST